MLALMSFRSPVEWRNGLAQFTIEPSYVLHDDRSSNFISLRGLEDTIKKEAELHNMTHINK